MLIKIIFAVIVGATMVGLVWYFVVFIPDKVPTGDALGVNTQFPIITEEQEISRKSGSLLTTDNNVLVSDAFIVENEKAVELETGFYEVTDNPKVFSIFYLADGGNMTVMLYGADTKKSRLEAERYLLSTLKFSKEQLCSVVANVLTNEYENADLAGISLGFSFCQGSVKL